MAVGHSILVSAYYVIREGVPYRELVDDWLLTRDRERQTRRLVSQLGRLGHIVRLETPRGGHRVAAAFVHLHAGVEGPGREHTDTRTKP